MRTSSAALVVLLSALSVAPTAPVLARRPGDKLVLATSAQDPRLIESIVGLGPRVDPKEAQRIAEIAYTTGRELAQKWRMVSSPTLNNFLINIGARKAGYCFHFAHELLYRLDGEKLKSVDLHWAGSDWGTDTEHNVIVVTAKGQAFEEGILLDNWRRSGRLLWGPLNGDASHTWTEYKDEYERRRRTVPPTRRFETPQRS